MVSRSHIVHYGGHLAAERQQWRWLVFHTNGDNLYRRLDASWSSMESIQSQSQTVGGYWGLTAACAPRLRCWRSPLDIAADTSLSRIFQAHG